MIACPTRIGKSRRAIVAIVFALVAGGVFAEVDPVKLNVNAELLAAARARSTTTATALLDRGANPDARDRNGDSALQLAIRLGATDLARLLIDRGASVDLRNLAGVSPLMSAAFHQRPDVVRMLLAARADIAPVDRVKKTAAIYAAAGGCAECLAALLDGGVLPDSRDENDSTLLMWASGYGQERVVELLLQRGAKAGLRDNRGKTARTIAEEGRQLGALRLLEKAGAP